MARTKAAATEKKDNGIGFTVLEMIEFENYFKVPFQEITNPNRPRMEMWAFCGMLKRRRDNPTLSLKEYLALGLTLEDIQKEAFDLTDEDIEEAEEKVAGADAAE